MSRPTPANPQSSDYEDSTYRRVPQSTKIKQQEQKTKNWDYNPPRTKQFALLKREIDRANLRVKRDPNNVKLQQIYYDAIEAKRRFLTREDATNWHPVQQTKLSPWHLYTIYIGAFFTVVFIMAGVNQMFNPLPHTVTNRQAPVMQAEQNQK